jgi:hypothetical protein
LILHKLLINHNFLIYDRQPFLLKDPVGGGAIMPPGVRALPGRRKSDKLVTRFSDKAPDAVSMYNKKDIDTNSAVYT